MSNLTKDIKDLHTKKYKMLLKEIKEDINETISHVYELEDLIC